MAKRSPILGYNHNVRYRGLVFHVQTEDSGVLAPHVFTHLFHGGVILSTRKLVYDAGASEDVIRSLMQAQHKAVLKELRRGNFDDKVDEYLGGTPGLLPRGAAEPASSTEATGSDDTVGLEGGPTEPIPIIDEASLSEAAAPLDLSDNLEALPEAVPVDSATPQEIASQETIPIELPPVPPPLPPARTTGPLPGIPRPKTGPVPPIVTFRDEAAPDLAAAAQAAAAAAAASSAVPEPAASPARETGRMAIAAASLPPPSASRPITTPRITSAAPPRPAITPPVVVARDLDLPGTDSAEIYSPPPPSADAPPGLHETPGAYSVRRRDATSDPTPAKPPVPSPRPAAAPASQPRPAVRPSAPAIARPSTPPAVPVVRQPVPATPPTAAPRARPTGGVVMSRPAVIVGAPRTSPPPTKGRAGEEDRRGFGQGLISEKSLDEVILAYLSEDAADE